MDLPHQSIPPPPPPPPSFDMWNVRLRLAVFTYSTTSYRLLSLAGGGGGEAGGKARGVYRGPSLELLQPGGATHAGGDWGTLSARAQCQWVGWLVDWIRLHDQ